jgi:hypothetical protein
MRRIASRARACPTCPTHAALLQISSIGQNDRDTLDLSGYSGDQVINLVPGTLSDAGALKQNISNDFIIV